MSETRRTPVFTRYELLEELGSGGMGAVYKARQKYVGRLVAFKVLPPALRNDAETLQRFKREAAALGRLKHPNVVGVFDAGVEGGFPYLAMEFVEGQDLRKILQKRQRLSVKEVIQLGVEMAKALAHVHNQEIVHRDVKPSNIMIRPDGQAVLTDFGIAFAATLPRITHVMLGTPEYMSPEQIDGKVIDGQSDLYSLGVVLYECLVGTVPFQREGENLTAIYALGKRIQEEPVPTIRRADVPPWLSGVIAQCLAKKPKDRFKDGNALSTALRAGASATPEATLEAATAPKPASESAVVTPTPRVTDAAQQEAESAPFQKKLPEAVNEELLEQVTPEAKEKHETGESERGLMPQELSLTPSVSSERKEPRQTKRKKHRLKVRTVLVSLLVIVVLSPVGYFGYWIYPSVIPPKALRDALRDPDVATTLDLSSKRLRSLPESIAKLTNLTTLNLARNELTDLPESIGSLTNLTTLDLRGNELTNLPESISKLTNLTRLDLGDNELRDLPESIATLTNLTRLYLGNLSRYDPGGNTLTDLPESIGSLTNLTELDLYRNNLTSLPESISNLTKLETLDLGSNALKIIPGSISDLTNLRELNLSLNDLWSVPGSISNLTNLRELNLSFNNFKSVPGSILNLTNLRELNLSSFFLTTLPEKISNLTNLKELDLTFNPISQIEQERIRQLLPNTRINF